MSTRESQVYEFGEFRLDSTERLLRRRGEPLPLTPRVFDTLLYFVRHHGRVLTKDELMGAIWPDSFVEENNLSQNVSTLRRVLGESHGENLYIVTVPGRGYRFAAEVRTISSNVAPPPDIDLGARSFAVLPFKPIVADTRDEVLELGMADTMIVRLSQSKEIIVRPLSSVRRYCGLEQDAQAAGRELGVQSVLDGSIQRSNDRIRVTARLINVEDGASLWVGTFNENFTDVFAVQDAIAERVAGALAPCLNSEERRALTKRYTENTEAYELYLKGRYHWSKLIPPEVRKSIHFFQEAIEIDPTYALAYIGLAAAHISLPISSDAVPDHAFPQSKAALTKAIEIDPSLSDAHAYLAFVKFWYDWDWDGAEAETRLALSLNPNSSEAHRAHALLLSTLGRQEEAIAEAVIARELDPLSLITRLNESLFLYYNGQYSEAEEKLGKTLELDPNFWIARLTLGKVYLRANKHAHAIAEFSAAKRFSGGNTQTISMIGYAWALSGDRRQALASLDELKDLSTRRYVPPCNIAMVYNGLGEDDDVFLWLERACDERDVILSAFITVDPSWDRLRSDQRFAAILKRMNLE